MLGSPKVLVRGARTSDGVEVSDLHVDQFEVTNEQFAAWLNSESSRLSLRDNARLGAIDVHHDRWGRLAAAKPSGRTAFGAMGIEVNGPAALSTAPTAYGPVRFSAAAGEADRPVRYVSWSGAAGYCRAVKGRLPTVVEWEHLAGVNRTAPAWRAALANSACEGVVAGRHNGGACEAREWRPQAVGSALLDRSPEGVFDVAGNLAEWTSSRFALVDSAGCWASDAAVDARSCRSVKGGDYASPLAGLRLRARRGAAEELVAARIGFRCVKPR